MSRFIIPRIASEESTLLEELSEQTVSKGTQIKISSICWKEFPCLPLTEVSLAHDGKAMLLHFHVEDNHLLARYDEPNSPVYTDSCVELFVRPEHRTAYQNFEFNALGTCLSQTGTSREDRTFLSPSEISTIRVLPSITTCPTDIPTGMKWSLFVAIPFALISDREVAGTKLWLNLYKCGEDTITPHFVSSFPIDTPAPDFHRPEFFQEVEVEK